MDPVWYLWAIDDDPQTNRYLAQVVGATSLSDTKNMRRVRCTDGKKRNLFICPDDYENVKSAVAGIHEFNLKLEVFKEDIEGVITRYDLWKGSARKNARAAQHKAAMVRPSRKAT